MPVPDGKMHARGGSVFLSSNNALTIEIFITQHFMLLGPCVKSENISCADYAWHAKDTGMKMTDLLREADSSRWR